MKKITTLLAIVILVGLTGCTTENNQSVNNSEEIIVTKAPQSSTTTNNLSDVIEEVEQRIEDGLPVLRGDTTETLVMGGYTYGEWTTVLSFSTNKPYVTIANDTCRVMADGYEYVTNDSGTEIVYKYNVQERTRCELYKTAEISMTDTGERDVNIIDEIVAINANNYTEWEDAEIFTSEEAVELDEKILERVISGTHEIITDDDGNTKIIFNYIRQIREAKS